MRAFYDEELVTVGADRLTLAIDFRAIDRIEHLIGEPGSVMPMTEVIALIFADAPPRAVLVKALWALLRRHHETLTLDMAAGLMFTHGSKIAAAMRSLLVRAMNLGEQKAKDENPQPRRGASKPS